MKFKPYVPLYSITLLLSASLLFSVQPMFSKMILPMLGGTPQVWNTAMLFFQILLLAGYAYAHGTTKLFGVRVQAIVHLILIAAFAFVLPIAIPTGWTPPTDTDPTLWQLSLMAVTVGGPFFILSGSAPMLQRWFSTTDHPDADNPYFLYGASNLGSMTALLAYPVLIEPALNLTEQSQGWMYGYIALGALTLLSALAVWNAKPKKKSKAKKAKEDIITWARRGKWLLLAAIPSSLMLGVTTYITTDIASVPLLWVVPLALYVGTFIIVFARKQIISTERTLTIFGYLLITLIAITMSLGTPKHILIILFHLTLFFFAALACHMELSDSKPRSSHLTEFYLMMSIGGALGGVFNALIAPNLFLIPLEYAIALGAAACMRFANQDNGGWRDNKFLLGVAAGAVVAGFIALNLDSTAIRGLLTFVVACALVLILDKRWLFGAAFTAIILLAPPGHVISTSYLVDTVHQGRNFFGIIKVADTSDGQRLLLHGTTNHGTQALDPDYALTPFSYYGGTGPIANTFEALKKRRGKQNVAVLGLGVGVTACLGDQNTDFDFFEIDPEIAEIAEDPELFTFLSECGAPYEIILGDARLTIADQPDGYYDYMLVDVYSSDNIPVHLITLEAIELYLQKLKPDGILAFNISNNYLDIEAVLAEAAKALDIPGYAHVSLSQTHEATGIDYYASQAFSFARTQEYEAFLKSKGWSPARFRDGVKLWTDKFSNIVGVLGNHISIERLTALLEEKKEKEAEKTE